MALPDWMRKDKDGVYSINADAYYPMALQELGVTDPTQYDLEVVHNWLKMDALVAARQDGAKGPVTLIVGGDAGYKERWGWRGKPAGKHQDLRDSGDEMAYAKAVAAEARELYKKARGFLPT